MKYFFVMILFFCPVMIFGQVKYIRFPDKDIIVTVKNLNDTNKVSLLDNNGYIKIYKIPYNRILFVQYFSSNDIQLKFEFYHYKKKIVKTPDILLSKKGKPRYIRKTMYLLKKILL